MDCLAVKVECPSTPSDVGAELCFAPVDRHAKRCKERNDECHVLLDPGFLEQDQEVVDVEPKAMRCGAE